VDVHEAAGFAGRGEERRGEIPRRVLGGSIREIRRLTRRYGRGRWRKRKGVGRVMLANGMVAAAELPWVEAHGIGRRKLKIKRLLDQPS